MIRALSIIAAIVALAVTAAPVASAGTSKAKAPRTERATAFVWLAELSPVKADSMFHGTGGDGGRFAKAPPSVNNMFAGDDS